MKRTHRSSQRLYYSSGKQASTIQANRPVIRVKEKSPGRAGSQVVLIIHLVGIVYN